MIFIITTSCLRFISLHIILLLYRFFVTTIIYCTCIHIHIITSYYIQLYMFSVIKYCTQYTIILYCTCVHIILIHIITSYYIHFSVIKYCIQYTTILYCTYVHIMLMTWIININVYICFFVFPCFFLSGCSFNVCACTETKHVKLKFQ